MLEYKLYLAQRLLRIRLVIPQPYKHHDVGRFPSRMNAYAEWPRPGSPAEYHWSAVHSIEPFYIQASAKWSMTKDHVPFAPFCILSNLVNGICQDQKAIMLD